MVPTDRKKIMDIMVPNDRKKIIHLKDVYIYIFWLPYSFKDEDKNDEDKEKKDKKEETAKKTEKKVCLQFSASCLELI